MNIQSAQSACVGVPRSWARLLTVASIAVAAVLSLWDAPRASAAEGWVQQPAAAVFTGGFDGGAPVYRLPSITVTAKRNVDYARCGADVRREQRVRRDLSKGDARLAISAAR